MVVPQGVKPMDEYESLIISPFGLGPSDGGVGSHTRAYELTIRSIVWLEIMSMSRAVIECTVHLQPRIMFFGPQACFGPCFSHSSSPQRHIHRSPDFVGGPSRTNADR